MESNGSRADQVTVFSREGCVQCNATYRALDARNIDYTVQEVTDAIASELSAEGFMQLPVVKAPNVQGWSGFRPDKIDELAAILGGAR